MKARIGWVSNSSSTSFIFPSPEVDRRTAVRRLTDRLFPPTPYTKKGWTLTEHFMELIREDIFEALEESEADFSWEIDDFTMQEKTVVKIDDVETFEKYLGSKVPKKYSWLIGELGRGNHLYKINVPDYGEGGSRLQAVLRSTLITKTNMIIETDDLWGEVNKMKAKQKAKKAKGKKEYDDEH